MSDNDRKIRVMLAMVFPVEPLFQRLLHRQPDMVHVGTCHDISRLMDELALRQPDTLLIHQSYRYPAIIQSLHERFPDLYVIALTVRGDSASSLASRVLTMPYAPHTVLEAIREHPKYSQPIENYG
jgi:hypothetical protein